MRNLLVPIAALALMGAHDEAAVEIPQADQPALSSNYQDKLEAVKKRHLAGEGDEGSVTRLLQRSACRDRLEQALHILEQAGAKKVHNLLQLFLAQRSQLHIAKATFTRCPLGVTSHHLGFIGRQLQPVERAWPYQFSGLPTTGDQQHPQLWCQVPQGKADGDTATDMTKTSAIMGIEQDV